MIHKNSKQNSRSDDKRPSSSTSNKNLQLKVMTKKIDVFVPCHSYEDAKEAALNHGLTGYYNTPIYHPVSKSSSRSEFDQFNLGRNHKRMYVMHDGVQYNYIYYFGRNGYGEKARKEKGCDKPDPYYYNN